MASLTSSATFGGALDIALRLSVFSSLRVFILCMTDIDDVALLELQVAVLLISRLRFCGKFICVFVAVFLQFHSMASGTVLPYHNWPFYMPLIR